MTNSCECVCVCVSVLLIKLDIAKIIVIILRNQKNRIDSKPPKYNQNKKQTANKTKKYCIN